MELTTEELSALMDWATQTTSRRYERELSAARTGFNALRAERDAAITERDALQAQLAQQTSGRLSERNPNEQHLQPYDEVVAERDLKHAALLDVTMTLNNVRTHRDELLDTNRELRRRNVEMQEEIARLMDDLQEARSQRDSITAPAGARPVFDVYARWTPSKPLEGRTPLGGWWTVHVFNHGMHERSEHEVLLFTVHSNGLSNVTNWRLHDAGTTSME